MPRILRLTQEIYYHRVRRALRKYQRTSPSSSIHRCLRALLTRLDEQRGVRRG